MKKGPTKDDVSRLTKGKPTESRVGSREVSHRLRLDERKKLDVAIERGFLTVTITTRAALKNCWFLWCQANKIPCAIIERLDKSELIILSEKEGILTEERSLLSDQDLSQEQLHQLIQDRVAKENTLQTVGREG